MLESPSKSLYMRGLETFWNSWSNQGAHLVRLLGDFHIRAQLDESRSMVVWGGYTPYIICHQYAIYYMPSTKIYIIGVSSGEGWDGSGEAGAEGHRQLGHRHGRQPPHGQVARRNLTSSQHCFTSLTLQVFCDSLHHLCLHHSYEDNCLFHCYGKNVFLLLRKLQ